MVFGIDVVLLYFCSQNMIVIAENSKFKSLSQNGPDQCAVEVGLLLGWVGAFHFISARISLVFGRRNIFNKLPQQ